MSPAQLLMEQSRVWGQNRMKAAQAPWVSSVSAGPVLVVEIFSSYPVQNLLIFTYDSEMDVGAPGASDRTCPDDGSL